MIDRNNYFVNQLIVWTLKTVSSDYPSNEDFSFEKALKESSEKEKCLQHIKTRKQRWKCECLNQKCCVNVNFFFSIRPAAKSGFEEKFLKYWTKKFDGIWNRSSHRRCSVKIDVLRNFAIFTGKHLCQNVFFNKVAGLAKLPFLRNTSVRHENYC